MVHNEIPEPVDDGVGEHLRHYAYRQLTVVLTPRPMRLRRLVIGEVSRFPDLTKVLYEHGPRRALAALAALAALFERLADRGLLAIDDPMVAAFDDAVPIILRSIGWGKR